jgi:mRNA-degrading endonuclease RelE of RelBE toxin-antitoxin system
MGATYEIRLTRQVRDTLTELPDWQQEELQRVIADLSKSPGSHGRAVKAEKGRRVFGRGGYRAVYEWSASTRQVSVLAITAPVAAVVGDKLSIWELPKFDALRKQPLGSPVELTRDEAIAIVREAFASMPELPPGPEYVRQVRPLWAGLAGRPSRQKTKRPRSRRD